MSIYCISDIHGRDDLFFTILQEIEFDVKKDTMYILGDIIDRHSGAIDILRFVLRNRSSFVFILGNHEYNFLNKTYLYDKIFSNDVLRKAYDKILEDFGVSYSEIHNEIKSHLKIEGYIDIEKEVIRKWMLNKNNRVISKRKKMINSVIEFAKLSNPELFEEAIDHLVNVFHKHEHFQRRYLLKELFKSTKDEYEEIREYLMSCKLESSRTDELKYDNIKICIEGRQFILAHQIGFSGISQSVLYGIRLDDGKRDPSVVLPHIKDMNVKDTYIVYGHKPVPTIHRELNFIVEGSFDFDYRQAFSYIDRRDNHYYNINLDDNMLVALRLNDLNEYYSFIPKRKSTEIVDFKTARNRKIGYMKAEFKVNKVLPGALTKIVSVDDGAMEYIIGIDYVRKIAYFRRVDSLPYGETRKIKVGIFSKKTIEEVIGLVIDEDKKSKRKSHEIELERFLINPFEK